jgi:predicted ATPase
MPKLTAIELENFQTISEHTVIPIRNLTMMFGPNGAGKSSIFDALELLKLLFSEDWGANGSAISDLLNRWARKENSQEIGIETAIGIQFQFEKDWTTDYIDYEKLTPLKNIYHSSIGNENDYDDVFNNRNFRFFIKFKKVSSIFSGWKIWDLTLESEGIKIIQLSTSYDGDNIYRNLDIHDADWLNLLPIKSNKHLFKQIIDMGTYFRLPIGFSDELNSNYWFDLDPFMNLDEQPSIDHLISTSQQVINFFGLILNAHFFATNNKDLPLVKASRTVPSREDVISIVPGRNTTRGEKYRRGQTTDSTITLQTLNKLLNKQQPHWIFLCAALADITMNPPEELDEEDWFEWDAISKINYMLREDLFIENGYQLCGEILCLTQLWEIADNDIEDQNYYAKIVRLYLKDQQQRNVEIEDVGSGIGYVLPVLASLAQNGRPMIQQPELHLHPALQSNLGDAIVRSVENHKFLDELCIIETHSEHILLRIMKLIKNAASRKDHVVTPLTFENVSILYFDPRPNGSTKVKRLRLSPDGKLIDRWPGGFFNERYKDLFDDE